MAFARPFNTNPTNGLFGGAKTGALSPMVGLPTARAATLADTARAPFKSDLGMQTPGEELSDMLSDMVQAEPLDALAHFVKTCFRQAHDHRANTGTETEMHRAARAVRNEYNPEDRELINGVDIYMGVTNLKVRALKSWLTDIMLNADDQPWTLKPTPNPDLSQDMEDLVVKRLQVELAKYGAGVDLPRRARELKSLAKRYQDRVAAEAAAGMELTIKDQLLEGGWRDAFDAFTTDLAMFPTAIIKGPYLRRKAKLVWDGNDVTVKERYITTVQRVDPFDFFPSPNSTNTQDGAYVIERVTMHTDELLEFAFSPGFNELGIRAAIDSYPTGYRQYWGDNAEAAMTEGRDPYAKAPEHGYSIIVYYGKVPVSLLQDHMLGMDLDPQKSCEAEVWVLGDYVLKAAFNPHPLGERPYWGASFQNLPGSFWGQSLPFLLRDVQRVCNSAARSLVRNMAYSSGPIVEADARRLSTETQFDDIQPWRIYYVENDSTQPNSAPAMRFNVIPSVANELMKVFDEFTHRADDTSGIPAYVLGNPQVAGAGRTLGGLSMLMGNAAKGVKQVVANLDRRVTEPLIRSYYVLEMLFGTDPSIKGDITVIARGASGILQRELSQARASEMLQIIAPYVQSGAVPTSAVLILLREVFKSMGYQAVDDVVPDPERADLLTALGGRGAPPQSPRIRPPGAGAVIPQLNLPVEPKLDGRSEVPPNPGDERI